MSCPICGKLIVVEHHPFCSPRCADLDLAKWLNGSYAVPSNDPDDIEDALEASEMAQNALSKPH